MHSSRALAIAFSALLSPALTGCGSGGGGGGGDPGRTGGGRVEGLERVAAGDVTDTSVVLWARRDTAGPVHVQLATDAGFATTVDDRTLPVGDPSLPVKFQVTGLAPATTYFYRALPEGAVGARGTFRTLPAATAAVAVHFGVGGDWRGDMAPFPSVRNAPDLDLDFWVSLGDTIYADVASPDVPVDPSTTIDELRRKHREVYTERTGLNTLGEIRSSTAVFATIDDHEVTDDFAGAGSPANDARFVDATMATYVNDAVLFETGVQAFSEWNPIVDETWTGTADPVVEGEVKLYRSRRLGTTAAFMLLDTRSFRSVMLDNPDPLDSGDLDRFRAESFDSTRTMLGLPQLDLLLDDLQAAHLAGVTWKFVMIPEPIQNLGLGNPRDRMEGYAYERSRILAFVHDQGVTNVVFVTADIHGTVVNNLQYQATSPGDPQIDVASFEISAPAVAYDPPLGQDTIDAITLTDAERSAYEAMSMDAKDDFFRTLLDAELSNLGYDETGLEGSAIPATLVEGKYVRAHAFGWVEFAIDPTTLVLTVTVWGIEPYEPDESASAADRVPSVLLEFTVSPTAAAP